MPEARGLFVSFEGIDGSGKSTQARLLAETLRATGREVVLTREPGGSPGAEEIRTLLLTGDKERWSPEAEVLLFTAARRDHLERTIQPAIEGGAIVVTDRFADSTRVYQGVARAELRGTVDLLHRHTIKVDPDLTILIDMDPRVALGRSLQRHAVMQAGRSQTRRAKPSEVGPPGLMPEGVSPEDWHESETARLDHEAAKLEKLAGAMLNSDTVEARFEFHGLAFQEKLRTGFLDIAREFPNRIVVVDGSRNEQAVAADVAAVTFARL